MADKHAPAGLMGDHVHERGEVMVEYKYMHMNMHGNRIGTERVLASEAFVFGQGLAPPTNVGVTPTGMTMDMHMLHLMYGLSDRITIYTMPMWSAFSMNHLRANPFPANPGVLDGQPFTTQTDDFHDLSLGVLRRVYQSACEDLILNLGLSVPTGDITSMTTIPNSPYTQEFPYAMRHVSGTVNHTTGRDG